MCRAGRIPAAFPTVGRHIIGREELLEAAEGVKKTTKSKVPPQSGVKACQIKCERLTSERRPGVARVPGLSSGAPTRLRPDEAAYYFPLVSTERDFDFTI